MNRNNARKIININTSTNNTIKNNSSGIVKSVQDNLFFYVIGLITVIAIIFWIYYAYFYQSKKKKESIILISNPTNITGEYESKVNLGDIILDRNTFNPPNQGMGLTLVWDMYISNNAGNVSWDTDFTRGKPIFSLDDNIIIRYHPNKGNLFLYVKFKNINNEIAFMEVNLGYIKMQKWNRCALIINENHVIFTVDNNIQKSRTINIVPIIKGMIVKIGEKNNNFLGKIRYMELVPYPISINELN